MPRQIEDYEIKSKARSVLVKYWIDTTRLSIGVHRGVITVFGDLQEGAAVIATRVQKRIEEDPFMDSSETENLDDSKTSPSSDKSAPGSSDPLAQKLFLIEKEMEDISGVRAVSLDFSNYKKNGGIWKKRK